MRAVRRVLDEILGLFVADWRQAVTILAVLAVGALLIRSVGAGGGGGFVLAVLLAAQLLAWCVVDARRRLAR